MPTETIREAVAVFDDPEALEDAVSELQSRGIDRADLRILAPPSGDDAPPNAVRTAARTSPPRGAVVTDTDLRQERILGTSLAATIAAFLAAGITVATGGVAAATVAATVAAAGGAGIAGTLIGRKLAEEHVSFSRRTIGRRRCALMGSTSATMGQKTRCSKCCGATPPRCRYTSTRQPRPGLGRSKRPPAGSSVGWH